MADTLPNITIPANTWVNLYTASGIAVGTQIRVKLIGGGEVKLVAKATQPTNLSAYDVLVSRAVPVTNRSGDSGAWAYSTGAPSLVNVEIV